MQGLRQTATGTGSHEPLIRKKCQKYIYERQDKNKKKIKNKNNKQKQSDTKEKGEENNYNNYPF